MNFGLNTLQNHHLEPRNRLDLIMMELPQSSEEAAGSTAVEFDGGGGGGGGEAEREHMFDKVVTPSDVGKLNRLVIPKQHAERFFPLDSSTNEKGLLLNFEDRNGKSWRFRYSYWNSSQSYVMTKGWSRFVKEKRLDAGDIVSFQRGVGEIGRDRLYIDWRRRPELPIHLNNHHHHHHAVGIQPSIVVPTSGTTWEPLVWQPLSVATTTGYHPHPAAATPRDQTHWSQINNNSNKNYSSNNDVNNVNVLYDCNRGCCSYGYGSVVETPSGVVYLRTEVGRRAPRLGDEEEEEGNGQVQQEYCKGSGSMGVVQGNCRTKNNNYNNHNKSSNKDEDEDEDQGEDTPVKRSRLRLFGVNMEMECPNSSSSDECHLLLSSSNSNPKTTTITTPAAATHQFQFQLPSPSHPHQI